MGKSRPFAELAEQRPTIPAATNDRAARPRALRSALYALCYLLLFLIALYPRVTRLADFITTDEAYHWVDRVAGFSDAIARGRWAQTILTGHPGVTTMWLGT